MNPAIFLSCAVFVFYLLLLPTNPLVMFTDPDTYWHIATGDLIRSLGALPAHDTWSLSAGNQRWYNTAWGWDVAVSFLYRHAGWHGVIAMNSIIISATLSVVFATCLIRSRDGISAFIATLLAAILFNFSVRPHQCSLLFTAILMLLLTQVSQRRISYRWLLAIPLLMAVWVNIHGGFIIAFFLLGMFGLEAMAEKNWRLFRWLFTIGAISLLFCLMNPYGIDILSGIGGVMGDSSKSFVLEWQSLSFSAASSPILIYLFLFFVLVILRPLPAARSEKWIAYAWMVLGIFSIRHLSVFAIVSSPLLALSLHRIIAPKPEQTHTLPPCMKGICSFASRTLHSATATWVMLALSAGAGIVSVTPFAARLYQTENFNPLPDLSQEIHYVETHYPQARLLNQYNLGGPLIFLTRGKIPVFIDGRAGTAYPQSVIRDYAAFHNGSKNWPDLFDRYHLNGALILSSDHDLMERLSALKGWRIAFRGKTATLFIHDGK